MVREMRKIPPPQGQGVANVDGRQLVDGRLPNPTSRSGPFSNVADFHKHLPSAFKFIPRNNPEINGLIERRGGHWRLVFTHGDLISLNGLVRGDKTVRIVDWEPLDGFQLTGNILPIVR